MILSCKEQSKTELLLQAHRPTYLSGVCKSLCFVDRRPLALTRQLELGGLQLKLLTLLPESIRVLITRLQYSLQFRGF